MALTQVQGGMILPSTTLTTPIVATTMGVGGATPSTSGAGITFPATQSASTDANTLDDYEEGTYTATVTSDGGTITLNSSSRTISYVKIGRQVNINGYIQVSAIISPSGTLRISLPFTASNTTGLQYACLVLPNSLASGNITNFWSYIDANSPTINTFFGGSTSVSATAAQAVQANTEFRVSATYYV
jgi:hypothetical protein